MIEAIVEYRKTKSHDITVVFDGWKTGQSREQQTVVGGVKVIYSRIGDRADGVIKRIISSHRREWIVVTSDRDIADHAWSLGSIPVSSEDFLNAMNARDLSDKVEEYEDDYIEPRRKGSARQLSKKEKAIKRAISKL